MRRWVAGGAGVLIAYGLQVSGWVSPLAAIIMWSIAALLEASLVITWEPVARWVFRSLGVRSKMASILTMALIGACLGAVIFGGVAWLYKPIAPYSVGVRSAMVFDGPGDMSLYMVGYRSMLGDTASPVFYLAHIAITNRQNGATTIEGYSAAVSDNQGGPWHDLMPISLLTTNLYVLGTPNPRTGDTLAISRGAYRLATPMTREDMAHAALLDASPKLEAELRTPIQPSHTVGGWAAFDLRDHETRGMPNYIRIIVRDSVGKSSSEVIVLPRRQPGDPEIDTQVGTITIGAPVNISGFHVRYYSAPY
jgi:hypothetical protein